MKKFILTESQYKILLKEMSDDISMLDMYNNVLNNPEPKMGATISPEKDLGAFDGWKRVRRSGINKMNLKNVKTDDYISQVWYDFVGSMINGIAIVIDNNKGVNAIDENGELLFRSWHEDINMRKDGEEYVIKDGPRVVVRSREDILNNRSLNESTMQEIDDASKEVDLNPTEAQREAGNYRMGHVRVKGMQISIENPKGSKRYYVENGVEKFNVIKNHYGYFTKSLGKDGDAVDVFLGPNIENFERVYCIDQNKKGSNEFDETKVMLGFNSKEEAKEAYLSNYSPGWKGFRKITSVPLNVFKKWLYRGRKQRQPFADYIEIKKKQLKESKQTLNEAYFREEAISHFPLVKLIYTDHCVEREYERPASEKMIRDDFVSVADKIVEDINSKKYRHNDVLKVINRETCLVSVVRVKKHTKEWLLVIVTCFDWDGRTNIFGGNCYYTGEESVKYKDAVQWNKEHQQEVMDYKNWKTGKDINMQHADLDKLARERYKSLYFPNYDDFNDAHERRMDMLNVAHYRKLKDDKRQIKNSRTQEDLDAEAEYKQNFRKKQLSSKGSQNRTLRAIDLLKQRKQDK